MSTQYPPTLQDPVSLQDKISLICSSFSGANEDSRLLECHVVCNW